LNVLLKLGAELHFLGRLHASTINIPSDVCSTVST